jgi:hypothetical protein
MLLQGVGLTHIHPHHLFRWDRLLVGFLRISLVGFVATNDTASRRTHLPVSYD